MKITAQYAAGMVDADGCVSITRQKPKKDSIHIRYQARVTVSNNCPLVADSLKETFAVGRIYFGSRRKNNPKHRDIYSWIVVGPPAIRFLELILPYMLVKQEQAELLLALQANINKHRHDLGGGHWLAPERGSVMDYREKLFRKCRDLKRTPYPLLDSDPMKS